MAAWGVAASMLGLAAFQLDWRSVAATFVGVLPLWAVAAVAANFAILPLWAGLWKLLLPASSAVPYGKVFKITAAMSTVTSTVPFMAGQATGVHLLATRGRTGHATALSVMAMEQFAEGVAKVALLLTLAFLAPLPPPLRSGLMVLVPATLALAAALWVAARTLPGSSVSDPTKWPGWWVWSVRFVGRWAHRLEAMRRPGILAVGIGIALCMKIVEGVALLMGQWAMGVQLPATSAVLVLASIHLATMVPVAPANLGVYEAACFAAYVFIGVDPATAAALALVHHLLILLPMAGTGPLVVVLSRGRPGR